MIKLVRRLIGLEQRNYVNANCERVIFGLLDHRSSLGTSDLSFQLFLLVLWQYTRNLFKEVSRIMLQLADYERSILRTKKVNGTVWAQ